MSFWTTPSGAGFRTLDFLVRRLPPGRRLMAELDGAVMHHEHYVTQIDRTLGQPRGNGDLLAAHMIEIARLKECAQWEPCYACGKAIPRQPPARVRMMGHSFCETCANDMTDHTANAQGHVLTRSEAEGQ